MTDTPQRPDVPQTGVPQPDARQPAPPPTPSPTVDAPPTPSPTREEGQGKGQGEGPIDALAAETAAAGQQLAAVRTQLGHAIIGMDDVINQVMAAMLAGGHVLLEGVPGVGKTLLALSLARTFGGRFARIQFTPDLMPSDVTGHSIYRPDTGEFRIRKGPAFTNLLLADEINRAPAKTQAALLEVMQEQQVSIEGQSFALPGPFMTVATQNPLEHEGTYPLPEAQLDRFLLNVRMAYPSSVEEEVAIVRRVTGGRVGDRLDVDGVTPVLAPENVLALQATAARLVVDERVLDYAVRLTRHSRTWGGLRIGTGTRGAIALVRTARALALIAGRSFVLPDDIKRSALPVFRHRVATAPELEMSGQTVDQILGDMIEDVEAPRQ